MQCEICDPTLRKAETPLNEDHLIAGKDPEFRSVDLNGAEEPAAYEAMIGEHGWVKRYVIDEELPADEPLPLRIALCPCGKGIAAERVEGRVAIHC